MYFVALLVLTNQKCILIRFYFTVSSAQFLFCLVLVFVIFFLFLFYLSMQTCWIRFKIGKFPWIIYIHLFILFYFLSYQSILICVLIPPNSFYLVYGFTTFNYLIWILIFAFNRLNISTITSIIIISKFDFEGKLTVQR